jgi:hypothetical protein
MQRQCHSGIGGVLTEVLADRVLLCPPFGPEVARASLAALRGTRLLGGYRDLAARDIPAVITSVVRSTSLRPRSGISSANSISIR